LLIPIALDFYNTPQICPSAAMRILSKLGLTVPVVSCYSQCGHCTIWEPVRLQNWAECGSGVECLLNTLGSILNTAEDKKENEGRKEGRKEGKTRRNLGPLPGLQNADLHLAWL
jgi:hypothetical protein